MCDAFTIGGSGFAIGFVGDALLNLSITRLKIINAGLRDYFPLHGVVESLFIAGGLVALTAFAAALLWERGFGLDLGYTTRRELVARSLYFFTFGAIVDNIFRFGNIMRTLGGMYRSLSPPVSMFFAGAPVVASYWLALLLCGAYDSTFTTTH